jgi:hypothetical protein
VDFVAGLVLIAGLLLAQGAVLVAFTWAVLIVVRRFPLIGRRHRHAQWAVLNSGGPRRASGSAPLTAPDDRQQAAARPQAPDHGQIGRES